MDINAVAALVAVLVGLGVGAVATWLVARAAQARAVEAEVAKSQAALGAELAQLRERVLLADGARRDGQAAHAQAASQLDVARAELDRARDEVARLTERAGQVAPLQLRAEQLQLELRQRADEVQRLAAELAGSTQQATSLAGQLQATTADLQRLEQHAEERQRELTRATADRAALEEQARRIEPLEQELAAVRRQLEDTHRELGAARESAGGLAASLQAERESLVQARGELDAARRARAVAEGDAARLGAEVAEARSTLDSERRSADEKLALLQQAQDTLATQFKLLANQILEEKSQKFAEQNKSALGALLEPLRTQLSEFKGKVEEVYVQEGKERSAMSEQLRQLMTLNRTLSQDAQNLTDALKGNAQVQGAWGEWVLEEMLTSSGLMRDEHYLLQDSKEREDGTRARPDTLINLPNERQLVVDSKVSLVAYEQYASAASDEDRAVALRAHLESMRRHIAGLSEREYQKLYPTLDFVLMFVPLEPAFMLAAAHDRRLFSQAWEKNVLLVSPSTLLFVLRTVAYLWRQEDQNRNAQAIADRGARLYDKFCDFLKDMESVGQRLDQAQAAFGDARRKLVEGNGNLVAQAQKLTALGVKGSKKLPPALLQDAADETDVAEELAALARPNTPREQPDAAT